MKKVAISDWPDEASRERWSFYSNLNAPFRLMFVAKLLDRSVANALVTEHINVPEWRVLAHLALLGEAAAMDLAVLAQVDHAEVSRAVRQLEARGHVARTDHPQSRAKKLLRLTERGRALAERIGESRRRHADYLLEDLDHEQRVFLDDIILHAVKIAGCGKWSIASVKEQEDLATEECPARSQPPRRAA